MRLSVEENDPGYCVEAHTSNVTVFCDGEMIHRPITVDDSKGYVKYFAFGFGRPIFHEDHAGDCQRLTLEKRGKIRIVILQ